ncbi:MAG: hypothetical protein NC418_06730 [Muribaculaceae bacterium]|nr:hypothetical protein [Muribaculaceae bacterium]
MKEYNENEAVERMCAVLPEQLRDVDAVCEVLDLIYDFYEENGDLDIDIDDDSEVDVDAVVAFIEKCFRKNAPAVGFGTADIAAMVRAEIAYEESLI